MEDKTGKSSLEFGEHERIQIVEGLQSKISAYKRCLANSLEEDEQRKKIEKRLQDAEQELQEFQAIKSVPSIYKEEGTEKPLVYYSDYLMLNRILNSQYLLSEGIGKKPAHDEMLFIIIHQVYELWFKQILYEVNQAISLISGKFVPSSDIGKIVHHLSRVTEIQKLLVQQINILETMSPMDFMEFRDYLFPASGFQSYQFRLLENLLGIDQSKRIMHERKAYHTKLSAEHQQAVQVSEKSTTLFDVIQSWLERFPFFTVNDFNFLKAYQNSVTQMLIKDKQAVMRNTKEESQPINSQDPSTDRDHSMASLQVADDRFRALFDEAFHNEQIASGRLRLSFKATQAALLILAYENEPLLYAPSRLLHILLDIDENLAEWRFKHMMMTQRMIGSRVGTGGSSGYWYLKSTVERSKVFTDIANLSSFLIPRTELPNLPQNLKVSLGFYHEVLTEEQHSQLQKNV